MNKEEFSNQLKAFKDQNPEIMEAINVLNINVDQYLRAVASLTPRSSTSSTSNYPS